MTWDNNRTNFERNLAVVIGIDRYDSRGIHDLQTAVSDANAIANLLRDEYGYKDEYIVRLFSPKNDEATLKTLNQPYRPATLEELRILLTETLPNQLKPTSADRLLFYFAGHGIPRNSQDGPAGYLVPQTAEQGKPDSFLPMRELHDALSKLECHHLLIILDCCFAGTFRWASSRKLMPILQTVHKEHYDRFIRYPAWQVLTSAAHDQQALDLSIDQRGSVKEDSLNEDSLNEDKKHSPFALALIEGLRDNKADIIQDQVITAHELYLYMDGRVNELSCEQQTPGIYPMRLEYDKGEYIFTRPGFKRDDLTQAPPLNEDNNPYRGLKPFEEKHSRFFFGRKTLVEALSHRLANSHRPLTVVLGASGSGKSSLVQAGLLPYLREKQKKEQPAQRWYILDPMRPGKSPFRELARSFLPVANNNLIAQLDQVIFLDKTFAEILDPNSKQQQKAASPNLTRSDIREGGLGDKAFDVYKLAECWNNGTSEAKLLLIVDYFNLLQSFCYQPQEQAQLSSLHSEINNILNQLTQELQKEEPQYFTNVMARWSQENANTKLLLVIDQFEELITMSQDKRGSGEQSDSQEQNEHKERQWFLSRLRITLVKYPQQLHIVLTLRSDFEPRFLNSKLKNYWKSARFPVRAMNSDELRDAIEGPALKQALYFEPPELVGKLIDEVGQMPGGLALLSFTLSELYIKLYERWTKDNATDRALRIEDYKELGEVAGALTSRAKEEYDNLVKKFGKASGKAYQATMRRVMLRMVSIEGGGVARRQVLASELEYSDPEENKRVEYVIEQLVNVRLLVKGHEDKAQYVEPAHDLLIQGWGLLQEWIKDEQENLVLQNRLTAPILDWSSQSDPIKRTHYLWKQDPRIELLEKNAKSENSWLNKLELDFLNACVQYRDQEASKRLEQQIKSNTETSQKLFNANDRLDAIVKMIETGKLLQKGPKISEYEHLTFIIIFNHLLSELGEFNSINIRDEVKNFSCNQENQVIATLSGRAYDKISFWNWSGMPIDFKEGKDKFYDLAFSPDGKTIVTGGNDGIIKFYRKEDNGWHCFYKTQGDTKKHSGVVSCVNFSPDGNVLVSVGSDRKINFWEREGKFIRTFITHDHNVGNVAFSPKGQLIAFVSQDRKTGRGSIKILEYQVYEDRENEAVLSQGNSLFEFEEFYAEHEGEISAIDFSPDGKTLVSAGKDGKLCIWLINRDCSKIRNNGFTDEEASISSVAFSPDGKIVASSHTNGIINLWDTSITEVSHRLQKLYKLAGHKDGINRISFALDGSQLLSSSNDGTVKFWSFKDRFAGQTRAEVKKVSFSADNQIVTTVDRKGNLKFWSSTGELLKISIDNTSDICDVQLTRDNEIVVVEARDREVEVKLYSLDGMIQARSIIKHEQIINSLNFSPKEDIFVTTSKDNTISLWRINRDLDNLNVKLWKTLTGHHEEITAITFSEDGKFFASGSDDGTIKLWNFDVNQAYYTIPDVGSSIVHNDLIERWCKETTDKIYALKFCYEDKIIVSINQAGDIEIWSIDGTSQKRIEALNKQALDIEIEAAAFSSNGKEIAIATRINDSYYSYRRIQTYNLSLENLVETACIRIQDYIQQNDIKFEDE
ncbi:caspase family protein [Scytonema hofmannii FACHB-248]|uniref:Caspase family protein n=1 Tax=Scytonema hofmannii FACHB-248 TaxID=1842502 RepID=A0ABR8GRT4_9CYAN|nr:MULTISPECIES: caspase family protein [Nostocales]MBD2605956.1 caspase family protein [Scytonema hofmannii FACHB-248]